MDGGIKQAAIILDKIRDLKLQLESQSMEYEEAPDNSQLIGLCMQFIDLYNILDKESRNRYFLEQLYEVVFPYLIAFHFTPVIIDGVAYATDPRNPNPFTAAAETTTNPFTEPLVQGAKLELHLRPTHHDLQSFKNLAASDPQSAAVFLSDDDDDDDDIAEAETTVPIFFQRQGSKNKIYFCKHGRRKNNCKDCGGSSICQHGRQKRQCKECGGVNICEHGRRRSNCKECGGSSICQHGRIRSTCKDCGGRSICQHGRQRSRCKDCGGSSICDHGRQRSQCKDCGGRSICQHGRRRITCKECKSNKQGGSKTRKSKKSYRNVKKSFRKNKKVVAHKKTKRLLRASSLRNKSSWSQSGRNPNRI